MSHATVAAASDISKLHNPSMDPPATARASLFPHMSQQVQQKQQPDTALSQGYMCSIPVAAAYRMPLLEKVLFAWQKACGGAAAPAAASFVVVHVARQRFRNAPGRRK